jgi:hypothetical protein
MSISTLITRIASAFPTEPTPSSEDVLYKGAYARDPELEEIKAFFGSRTWNSLTPADVFHFRHALSFFSSSALAYYAAAWMTCALLDDDAVDTAIEDLVSTLGKADPNLWTQEQRLAICEWLVHFNCSDLPSLKSRFESASKNLRAV